MTFKQTIALAGRKIAKHSPAILVTTGVVGLGVTAVLAYKSRNKVEAVVENIEAAREAGLEVNKVQVVRDMTEALYLPITVGAASVAAILWSYKIQNNRIAMLVSTVAAQRIRSIQLEEKYKEMHGEESYSKFVSPTAKEEYDTGKTDKEGNPKMAIKDVKADVDKTIGEWYSESTEYAVDDHTYNIAYIDSIEQKLQTILFARGHLLLNEVREALGFERTRNGALLGWSTSDSFEITKHVNMIGDEHMGEAKEQIWVTWSRPRYVHEEVEFTGRYSIHD